MKELIIAVDFDGTLVENKYPEIGEPYTELIEACKWLQQAGCKIILWSCRVGEKLNDAVIFCRQKGLEFDAINENLPSIIKAFGGDNRKIYADVYIDDRALCLNLDMKKVDTLAFCVLRRGLGAG